MSDPKLDDAIRAALKSADKQGKLEVVAAVTGIGQTTLKAIMNGTGPLDTMQRSMLGMHLMP